MKARKMANVRCAVVVLDVFENVFSSGKEHVQKAK
jgi:hypothetical protein